MKPVNSHAPKRCTFVSFISDGKAKTFLLYPGPDGKTVCIERQLATDNDYSVSVKSEVKLIIRIFDDKGLTTYTFEGNRFEDNVFDSIRFSSDLTFNILPDSNESWNGFCSFVIESFGKL